ncbi:MAG TPA: TIM-barrel domain-containing protein [Paludibacter sp.]|nr:TIM-barrel domain-containing protein [Paludibacter sp.]
MSHPISRKFTYLFFIGIIAFQHLTAQAYSPTPTGLTAKVQSMDIEVQFLSPTIVRVVKSPEGVSPKKQSLSVVKVPEQTKIDQSYADNTVTLRSSQIVLTFDLKTGKVSFMNAINGQTLFSEKDYGVQFTPSADGKRQTYLARQAFLLEKDEPIYGLGQQQNGRLNQRYQRNNLENGNTRVCIPFFQSLKGYGIFWDSYAPTLFTDNVQETSFESLGDAADYYFMYGGDANGVVAQMRDLTGQVPMLPLWGFGYLQSRERYKTQDELVGVVDKYRSLKVPLDGIIQDWQYWGADSMWNCMGFAPNVFPDPKSMVEKIHAQKAHLMIVAWPGFAPATKQYKEFKEKNMLINFDTWPPKANTRPYDPYNSVARDIYWDYLNKGVFSYGIDGWWLDSSEPDHINVKDKDFDQPTALGTFRSVINAFPLQHVRGVYEHQRATTSDKRVFILTRSAFAGQQRYGANTWSGDIGASWETLQGQIPAALNFALTGNPYWNADIGGFFLWGYQSSKALQNNAYRELYVRWIQFAAFTPMMRSHGTDAPREIYQFGERGTRQFDAIEKAIKLRYNILPYLYSTSADVSRHAGSIMRPLLMDFAADKNTHNLADEFMFGKNILVAPVVKPMYVSSQDGKGTEDYSTVKNRAVYLPQGTEWFDFWSGEKFDGGKTINRNAPIDLIPLFVKAGSIIPMGPDVQYAQEKKWDNLEVRVYPGADGEFTLYEDENDNYNYEKGACSTISFKWNDKNKTLTIGDRKGQFKGMLTSRKFQLVVVGKANGTGDMPGKVDKTVSYNGKALSVKL